MKRLLILFAVAIFGFGMSATAQQRIAPPKKSGATPSTTALSAEALSAKSLLEDLIVKRYSNELSTLVPRDFFTIGSQLELTKIDPVAKPLNAPIEEPITDLMLGMLDPEEILKKFSGGDTRALATSVLDSYRIKSVKISVGLKEESNGGDRKAEVEKWLNERVKSEFGDAGKGTVNVISYPEVKPTPRTFWDDLKDLQNLAGQIVLALAILLGTILWKLLSGSGGKGARSMDPLSVNMNTQGAPPGAAGAGLGLDEKSALSVSLEQSQKEQEKLAKDVETLSTRLLGLMPQISEQFDSVVRSWCQQGEAGKFRLVCFAEAVGRDLGRLQIPVDALPDVTKIFTRMPEVGLKEKKAALEKCYWDILAAMNLGADSLNQPFSYLGASTVETVNNVLMNQNPKIRTMVSLFLPTDLRERYVRGLDTEKKRELLQEAAQLSGVASTELKSVDQSLAGMVRGAGPGQDVIPLEMTIKKIAGSLSMVESIELLKDMRGAALQSYKRSVATLAFLEEWPDDRLSLLVSQVTVDELVCYLRLRPDLRERMIGLCPPLTAQMATDELNRENRLNENERNALLTRFTRRIEQLVASKDVDLEQIFPLNAGVESDTSTSIKRAA